MADMLDFGWIWICCGTMIIGFLDCFGEKRTVERLCVWCATELEMETISDSGWRLW
jgi:hypothetical protein